MNIRKALLALILLVMVLPVVQAVKCAEIDMTGKVASVHDGDTFTLTSGDKVRLADLNAPELGDEGADEATDYLDYRVNGKTVYLDVDDKYQTDSFGRLVCVIYVDYNSTHYLNVNEALIDGGYVEARDYDNEFNYNSFELYISKAQLDQPLVDDAYLGLVGKIVVFAAAALIIIIIALRKR